MIPQPPVGRLIKRATSVCAWAALLLTGAANADLSAHLERLKGSMRSEVLFTEEQGSALLTSPLLSSGVLRYRADDRALVKQVLSPEAASLTVLDNRLVVESGGRSRSYSLRSRPEMLALLGGFRALIEGDQAALEEHFVVILSANPQQHWELSLTPRKARLAKHLSLVQVKGHGGQVDLIETTLTSGDWQRLRLSPAPAAAQ